MRPEIRRRECAVACGEAGDRYDQVAAFQAAAPAVRGEGCGRGAGCVRGATVSERVDREELAAFAEMLAAARARIGEG